MTDLQDSNNNALDPKSAKSKGADKETVSLARRRFATAAPLILTLANRPAMANYCTISGAHSGNLSNADAATACDGNTPTEWELIVGQNPTDYPDSVNDYYMTNIGKDVADPDVSFHDALKAGDLDPLANIIAAELNTTHYAGTFGVDQTTLHGWILEENPCLVDLHLLNGVH